MFYPVKMSEVKIGGGYVFECDNEVESYEFAIREVDNGTRDLLRDDVTAEINGKILTINVPERYNDPKYIQLNINTIEIEPETEITEGE